MAKRKRLTPALNATPEATDAPLETKAHNGWVGYGTRRDIAPIADVAGSAAASAALDEVAHELRSARDEGRMIIKVNLEDIDETYLVRDRAALTPEDMDALKTSLLARGQQTPIEVTDLGQGRYGLISGWRRLTALKDLNLTHPNGTFGQVQCLIRTPNAAKDAYVAMVEENEVRAGLSFYERARIAVRAAEQGAFEDPRTAAKTLFSTAPRAKRSKIYSFIRLYSALDDVLRFPHAVSERLGLALIKKLEAVDGFEAQLRQTLTDEAPDTAEAEVALLEHLQSAAMAKPGSAKPKRVSPPAHNIGDVTLVRAKDKLVLSGAGVTDQMFEELKQWIEQRNRP